LGGGEGVGGREGDDGFEEGGVVGWEGGEVQELWVGVSEGDSGWGLETYFCADGGRWCGDFDGGCYGHYGWVGLLWYAVEKVGRSIFEVLDCWSRFGCVMIL